MLLAGTYLRDRLQLQRSVRRAHRLLVHLYTPGHEGNATRGKNDVLGGHDLTVFSPYFVRFVSYCTLALDYLPTLGLQRSLQVHLDFVRKLLRVGSDTGSVVLDISHCYTKRFQVVFVLHLANPARGSE
jgi:hypothetical protein